MDENKKMEIPVWKKMMITVDEACAYSSIGLSKMRKMVNLEDCPFVLWIGRKCLIKRKSFEEYLERMYSI